MQVTNSPHRSMMYTHKNGGVGKPHPNGQREKPDREKDQCENKLGNGRGKACAASEEDPKDSRPNDAALTAPPTLGHFPRISFAFPKVASIMLRLELEMELELGVSGAGGTAWRRIINKV